jgi:hypothetical protein
MGVCGQLHSPTTLPLEDESLVSVKRRLDWFQSQSRCCDKEKSLWCPCLDSNQNFPFIQSVAKSLYWLSHPITYMTYVHYCFIRRYLDFHRFEFRRFDLSSVFSYNRVSKFRRLLRSLVAFCHRRAILFLSSFSLWIEVVWSALFF